VVLSPTVDCYHWIASDGDRATLHQLRQESHVLRDAVLIGGATCVLASSALLLRPAGLSGVPEILSAWAGAWSGPDSITALWLFQVLIVYEPLILLFGLASLIVALRRLTGWYRC
jgi:hypothetical protein